MSENKNNLDFFSRDFQSLEINSISKQINEKGYFAFSKAINQETINRIHQDATKFKLNLNNNNIRGVYTDNQYFLTNLLSVSKKFYEFVSSQRVFDICKIHLGTKFRLKALRYYETYGKHKMQWHTDNKTDQKFSHIPGLIFIFYISDVDDGQFQYIEGSHLWSGKKAYNNYTDKYIQQNHRDRIKDFRLPSGSLIIYNTYGIHRAKPVFNKNFVRKSVFFQVDSEINNSEPIILNTEFISKVNDEIKMFFGFGNKSNYEVYPKTSINSVPLTKNILKILIKYILQRFLKSCKRLFPKKIKKILKNFSIS
jgi:hypothetical protein